MNNIQGVRWTITVLMFVLAGTVNAANLLRNNSFEDVPSGRTGQALMPSEWVTSNVTPDTYSNDGSYGLAPNGYSNFNGVTAYDGIRWVAGWSSAGQERFGQTLTTNLISGEEYTLSGYLQQAFRSDLNHSGGYEVYLTEMFNSLPSSGELLGYLGATTSYNDGWQEYSFNFTATNKMAALDFIMFAPTKAGAGEAYPGLDLVSLDVRNPGGIPTVPEASSIYLLAFGLLGLVGLTRRKI